MPTITFKLAIPLVFIQSLGIHLIEYSSTLYHPVLAIPTCFSRATSPYYSRRIRCRANTTVGSSNIGTTSRSLYQLLLIIVAHRGCSNDQPAEVFPLVLKLCHRVSVNVRVKLAMHI
ncbi:hypothetical protein BS17DRAFT_524440 [Gyrodon lividus]|nr:hypothetical protein BS17DRAFT_524440 [Gyrodon lividus]